MMNKILIAFVFMTISNIYSQSITNGSFENPSTPCPAGVSTLSNATGWSDPFILGQDTCSSSDIFASCFFSPIPLPPPFGSGAGTPSNILGYQAPQAGNNYAGIIVYDDLGGGNPTGWREYVQNQLTSPLNPGETYCLSVYVSLADQSTHAVSNFGVKFTNTQLQINCNTVSNSSLADAGYPADVSYTGSHITDTSSWTLLEFQYTAIGGEQYVTFGNFANMGATSAITVPNNSVLSSLPISLTSAGGPVSYYYVDNMSITQGVCCDATINSQSDLCTTDAPVTLSVITPGGTWSGTGITNANNGVFDPSVAGQGTHTITYNLSCGTSSTIDITVNNCSVPTASFTTSNTNICENDCIDFTSNSTGVGSSATYSWTFTGATNSTSTDQNPSNICYPSSGTYAVSLTVTDNGNTDDTTINSYITVTNCSNSVNVDFSISEDTICQTNCVTFTNNSTGSNIANYGWNFTGGTPSTFVGATPPQVCFSNPGNYQVTLVAADASNSPLGTDDTTIVVESCSNPSVPTASFTTSNTNICENDCIDFTSNSTGVGSSATYSWTFTGATNSTSTDQNPSNICYPSSGTYAVSLTVTDNGNTDDTTINSYITVTNCSNSVNVDFSISEDTICQTNCVTFTNNSTGSNIANYGWNFTGGTPSTFVGATPPQVCFSNPGNYQVTLVAADASNSPLGTDDTTIVVESCPVPTVNFTVSQQNICENACVNFTDQSFGIVGTATYNWSFPGSTTPTSNSQNPTNICYPNIGTYDVTLSVTDANATGNTTIAGVVVVSECNPPVPAFTMSSSNICVGNCISFTNESTNSDSYEWIFEGGFPGGSTDENPTNICFNNEGTFNISLIATNTLTSDTLTHTLVVNQPPQLTISDDITIFEGTNTVLSIETDGISYIWSPSSSLSCEDCLSTSAEPDSTTLYTVSVVANNGCVVTEEVLVTVVSVEAIGVPTAFSPNGDKVNDMLFVEGAGISKLNFNIYNRYGQKVFETSNQDIGWDGKYKGKEENPGVFAYTLEYVLNSGEKGIIKGNITLVK